jgi:hypothetical protein
MPTNVAALRLNPAYDADECLEILRIAAAVSAFIPLYGGGKTKPALDPFAPAGSSPIVDTVPPDESGTEQVLPSLTYYRWPEGWTAGIVKFPIKPTWRHSICCSFGPDEFQGKDKSIPVPSFSNQCLLTYNKVRDAWCLAFRGTMTAGNVLEDLLALPVPAGPVNYVQQFQQGITWIERFGIGFGRDIDALMHWLLPRWAEKRLDLAEAVAAKDLNRIEAVARGMAEKLIAGLPAGLKIAEKSLANWLTRLIQGLLQSDRRYVLPDIPGVSDRASVHAGFRIALESLDFAPSPLAVPGWRHPSLGDVSALEGVFSRNTLTGMLTELAEKARGKPIRLYVTGHSLGAGMASLAAAWLKTQPIAGAEFDVKLYAFAQPKPGKEYFSYAMASAFSNRGSFAVLNSLDTVPQVAMTLENLQSLNYEACIGFLLDAMGPAGAAAKEFFGGLPPWNYVHAGQVVLLTGSPVLPGAVPSKENPDNGFYNLPPVTPGGTDYQYPAYLFATAPPKADNKATPPPANQTLTPTAPNRGDPGMFQALWQHMPWVYMQALLKERKGG